MKLRPESSPGRIARLEWNLFAMCGSLGFGVKPFHPIATGALLIAAFAGVYFVGTNYYENRGYISAAEDGRAAPIDLADAAYFSVVTCTTLGYGDFHPHRSMRTVAALEAGVGALMLALLTAVIARRFLKL